MSNLPRLRQVALVAEDLPAVADRLQDTFGWEEPFHDPGVSEFGLENSVFAAGDTFIEVVAPVRAGTTAGRYLERRGGDSGYMAIFQVADVGQARKRIAAAGIRVVWQIDLPDMSGTHLHPKDVPGAIVSLDWADPTGSWRWAGPSWTGRAPGMTKGAIRAVTVEVADPMSAARSWAAGLGASPKSDGDAAVIGFGEPGRSGEPGQLVRFVPSDEGVEGGITEVTLEGDRYVDVVIGGVRFRTDELPTPFSGG